MSDQTRRTLAIAAALLFASAPCLNAAAAEAKIKCEGGNSCKGKSACHTTTHACAGQNSCKGKGHVLLTKSDCNAALKANQAAGKSEKQ